MGESRPRAGAIRSPNQCAESKSRAQRKSRLFDAPCCRAQSLLSFPSFIRLVRSCFLTHSRFRFARFRSFGASALTFIRGLPRYARPPLLKAVSFSRRPFAPLPRLRTLRSTSRLSALRTSSRGHGFAAWCFRSLFALAKKDAHYSATVPLAYASPSPRTFKRTLERLDVAPHARQNRQARHKRIKPPFPPPRGIPLSHALAGWSAGRLPPLQVQQCVFIRSWGQGLDA